ncbi:ATP-binding protein [Marinobacter sp. BGYM27]|uniref:sensor histidine kinase n=1 Tax=unclassified Marinobacter TaxID=83889 RepID=UPI0021A3BB2C|nr:ATP-binding protein [Marinobacter sp. BGYM27]MDG5501680.1 ATP-binding protein [Marinobacter sp. BGYM27]
MTVNWLRTASFRFAALSAVVFALSTLLLSILFYYTVREGMEQQLRERISTETTQLLGEYNDNGLEELRHDIGERLERAPSPRLIYTLVNPQGVAVFDRLKLPQRDGWSRIQQSAKPELLLLTTSLDDGFQLGVAANTRSIAEFRQAILRSTALTLCAVLVLSVVAGRIVSRRFLRHVERLRNIAEQVGTGSLSKRIPLADIGDDFEQLAVTINGMLQRIEHLVHDVQSVSVNIAHDLRTPLGRVRQQLEGLEELQSTEKTRQLCSGAIRNLDQALETFSLLLRIAEMDSATVAIEREQIDLSNLLERLAEIYTPVAEDSGQTLVCKVSGNTVIEGDQRLLTQMFANLVENAINHNGVGASIQLSVTSHTSVVEVVVADNGIGIPVAMRGEVLKPFFRIDPSRHKPGSGLGLSLASRIAKRHDATMLLADNSPGLRVQLRFHKA